MNKKNLYLSFILLSVISFLTTNSSKNNKEFNLIFLTTTDIHGALFPYDSISGEKRDYSLAHVSYWLKKIRNNPKNEVIYLDNGDFFQGDPVIFCCDLIDKGIHIGSEVLNYLKIDAITIGNHEIDRGPKLYNKVSKEMRVPFLGANVLHEESKKPYFMPYSIITKRGFKVAILGMTTTKVIHTVPKEMKPNIIFENIVESSKKWIPIIQQKESPDLIVGLFHSGLGTHHADQLDDDFICLFTGLNVDGFDVIFKGHDHKSTIQEIVSPSGKKVIILGGSYSAKKVSQLTFKLKKEHNKWTIKDKKSEIITFADKKLPVDRDFLKKFDKKIKKIMQILNKKIGAFTIPISSKYALFGPCYFIDFLHRIQFYIAEHSLKIPIDVSFAVPHKLTDIPSEICMKDLFSLYPYDNRLSIIEMTGQEIKDLLEFFLTGWFGKMTDNNSYLLDYILDENGNLIKDNISGGFKLKRIFLYFYNAAGIDFTVDLRKNIGKRIQIHRLSNNKHFSLTEKYKVGISDYIVCGGLAALVKGAKISKGEIDSRIIATEKKDLRTWGYLYIQKNKMITPILFNNWNIIPDEWYQRSSSKEFSLWFENLYKHY